MREEVRLRVIKNEIMKNKKKLILINPQNIRYGLIQSLMLLINQSKHYLAFALLHSSLTRDSEHSQHKEILWQYLLTNNNLECFQNSYHLCCQ